MLCRFNEVAEHSLGFLFYQKFCERMCLMSILINIICFYAGVMCGIVFLSLFVAAGKADEDAGIK